MSYIISITTKKDSEFLKSAKVILVANQYNEITTNTYIGTKPSSSVMTLLKNDSTYNADKTKASIVIYHGSVLKI